MGTLIRYWFRLLAAASLATLSGCLGYYVHPLAPPPPERAQPCLGLPKCCRDHVYVFFLNGLDPLNKDNLTGLRDYVNRLGFNQTYYCQLVHRWWAEREIRRIHDRDPLARFVLVGFSFGANEVCSITQALDHDAIPVDLVVYLGGDTLHEGDRDRPANANRVVNITAHGCTMLFGGYIWDGAEIQGAENLRVTQVGHSGLPTYPQTVEILADGLFQVASAVPVLQPPAPPADPVQEEAPPPRRLPAGPERP